MALPTFNDNGDLPEGIHKATLEEVRARFGAGSDQRKQVTGQLDRIVRLAVSTGKLDQIILFGSYVSDKADPNDVDVILVMRDDFRPKNCPTDARPLFDYISAETAFGTSVFWVRPGMLLRETLDEFIAHWQIKRDGTRRGIVEVSP